MADKLFSLSEVEQDQHSILEYVEAAMKEMKMGPTEIAEYQKQAKRYDFTHLLQISQEYIDMMNQMKQSSKCVVTYMEGY